MLLCARDGQCWWPNRAKPDQASVSRECISRNRCHHLLKTFYTGGGGWTDRQLPDGTVEWTAPSGHTYTTIPGGSIFFPVLARSTGELKVARGIEQPTKAKGLMMPRRKRTRAEDRDYRITSERRINEQRLAEERLAKQRRKHAAPYDPPPF